ncbi:hypothetical protein HWV62_44538 [Athelia sp. TMB]|nr:hypothetical protein HWV62_44538 [Athelia sp. TMB]
MYAPLALFIQHISTLSPGNNWLEASRDSSRQIENTLRCLFAEDNSQELLADPTVGVIDLFEAPSSLRMIHTGRVIPSDLSDSSYHYVFPLPQEARRKDGEAATVENITAFLRSWEIFTEGVLTESFDWNNVIAAGGSVSACIAPLPTGVDGDATNIRRYLHQGPFANADVDLFLWGLSASEAEAKVIAITKAVQDATPVKTVCVRTRHAISIISQHPYRTIQIVLRIYSSPAEIILSFDVDSASVAFNGGKVLITPRAALSFKTQSNTVDLSRRSPSYEYRLAKYHSRGFEVFVENLCRQNVNPRIYNLPVARTQGLARLLVLEKRFIDHTVQVSTPSNQDHSLSLSGYDVADLRIPYGPQWNADKIEHLVRRVDRKMNCKYNIVS